MIEDFFSKLLSFPNHWIVENIEHNPLNDEVYIYIKFNPSNYKKSHPKKYYGIHDYSDYRLWRHLNIMQYKTFIKAKLPRIKDENGKITTLEPSWGDLLDRHSFLFESRVIDTLLASKNQTKTAGLLQCSFDLVNRIIHKATRRGLERRNNNLSYVQKEKVEQVSVDMWEAFTNTVKEILPKSKIVHDRFHLIQYLNKVVDLVRRREVKIYEELKDSRYALLKKQFNLTL